MKGYDGLDVWDPKAPDQDRDLTHEDCIAAALRWAILAPSSHNSQPWRLHHEVNVVEVWADRTKSLPVVDPDDRELIMSCAALVTHLELALASFRRVCEIEWLPADGAPDLVARVTVIGTRQPTSDDMALFNAIRHRVTNRAPFRPLQVDVDTLIRAKHLVETHRAHLTFLTGDARGAVADLIAEGDRIQMADKEFRHELATWVHPNRSDHRDGIRGYALGIGDLISHVGPTIIRTFDAGKGQAAKDHQLATESPALVLIETDRDRPIDWVWAGRALDFMLLHLTAHGYAASFLNQPIEVPDLRIRLAETLGSARFPQLLLRVGEPSELTPHSPRHPVSTLSTPAGSGQDLSH